MAESEDAGYSATSKNSYRRAFWLKHLHRWHWVSAALCLVGLLLFAVTGFTLNHATWIASTPRVTTTTLELPAELLAAVRNAAAGSPDPAAPVPQDLARWLGDYLGVRLAHRQVEWSEQEIYVSLPRPGGDAWLTLDLDSGEVTHELTNRGWISYLNDLHKGRNTGGQWSLFIDLFALATLVFARIRSMNMNVITTRTIFPRSARRLIQVLGASLALSLSFTAQAHKAWMLPSATVTTAGQWITVDAAVSNDLFYFNHVPLRLDSLVVTAPDGSTVTPENLGTGKYRSVFDVHLAQNGTYKVAIVNRGLFAGYEVDGVQKRWRGTAERFAAEVPANATNLQVSESHSRLETFVTAGAPTERVFTVTNTGLELVPVTHPNDLVATFEVLPQ